MKTKIFIPDGVYVPSFPILVGLGSAAGFVRHHGNPTLILTLMLAEGTMKSGVD